MGFVKRVALISDSVQIVWVSLGPVWAGQGDFAGRSGCA